MAGAALVVLAGTVTATGIIPVVGIGLILGIHRFMGEGMAVTNTIGNAVAALVIGKWTGRLDEGALDKSTDIRQASGLRPHATGLGPAFLRPDKPSGP